MAINYAAFGDLVQDALRNLFLCRIRLQGNLAIAGTEVVVRGGVSENPDVGFDGHQFFHNNTSSAILVEPSSADTPSGIKHQEAATIHADTFTLLTGSGFIGDGNILLTAGVANAYTVAAGAYIRPATLRPVSQGLKFVAYDFIESYQYGDDILDEWFPGVLVTCRKETHAPFTNNEWEFGFIYDVYYCDLLHPDRNNSKLFMQKGRQLRDILMEDNYIGGTVARSGPGDIVPWHSDSARSRGVQFIGSPSGREIGWVRFEVWAKRPDVWDKFPLVS